MNKICMLDTNICPVLMREQPEAAIGPNDKMVAGHAVAAGAILVTNDTRECV